MSSSRSPSSVVAKWESASSGTFGNVSGNTAVGDALIVTSGGKKSSKKLVGGKEKERSGTRPPPGVEATVFDDNKTLKEQMDALEKALSRVSFGTVQIHDIDSLDEQSTKFIVIPKTKNSSS